MQINLDPSFKFKLFLCVINIQIFSREETLELALLVCYSVRPLVTLFHQESSRVKRFSSVLCFATSKRHALVSHFVFHENNKIHKGDEVILIAEKYNQH